MNLQKQNQQNIRQQLQQRFFQNNNKKHIEQQAQPKQPPKRAIRIQDGSTDSLKFDEVTIKKECKVFSQKYILGQMIGEGAHAIVRLAIDSSMNNRQVAVKICRSGDPELINTFIDSFKNTKLLNHQYIIKVYESYIDERTETLYMIMEYSEMPSLEQILINKTKLNEDQARAIMKSILVSLKHMHERGVAHRDLKPDNILVQQIKKNNQDKYQQTRDSINYEYYPIKIIDFGVSRKFKKFTNNSVTHTNMWTRTGSVYYCAPEIYLGGGYDEQIDVWSAGVILYNMLTGELPFYDESVSGTIDQILQGKYNENQDSLNALAKDLIKRLLNPCPEQRLTAQLASQHPWFYFQQKFDPISPNTENKSPHRASDDIYETPYNPLSQRNLLHNRSNTMTKAQSSSYIPYNSPIKSPCKSPLDFLLNPFQESDNECEQESQSPLIRLKKIQNQTNQQIHINKKPDVEFGMGVSRIKLKLLSQQQSREISDKHLDIIEEQEV